MSLSFSPRHCAGCRTRCHRHRRRRLSVGDRMSASADVAGSRRPPAAMETQRSTRQRPTRCDHVVNHQRLVAVVVVDVERIRRRLLVASIRPPIATSSARQHHVADDSDRLGLESKSLFSWPQNHYSCKQVKSWMSWHSIAFYTMSSTYIVMYVNCGCSHCHCRQVSLCVITDVKLPSFLGNKFTYDTDHVPFRWIHCVPTQSRTYSATIRLNDVHLLSALILSSTNRILYKYFNGRNREREIAFRF